MSKFKLSPKSIERLEGVHPDIILILERAIQVTPVDFGIPKDGGFRTRERQEAMFQDPNIKTKCNGFTSISKHQSGRAWDFYAYIHGSASWDKGLLSILYGVFNTVALQLLAQGKITNNITWGGTFGSHSFNGWDMGHIELS